MNRPSFCISVIALFFLSFTLNCHAENPPDPYKDVSNYISTHWQNLTRDILDCQTFGDKKINGKNILYFPANVLLPSAVRDLQKKCWLSIAYLPKPDPRKPLDIILPGEGLLYLPHPYVVPGGMFNEMYGWDSYFIIRGLLADHKLALAKGMIENFFFEIDYYGGILNANRSYYLSRSQPPFLSSMIMAYFKAAKKEGLDENVWLQKAYSYAVKDYEFWTKTPHLDEKTGLSRYYDFNSGPIPELKSANEHYFREAIKYFLRHPKESLHYLVHKGAEELDGMLYTVHLCPIGKTVAKENCAKVEDVGLSKKFYRSDRAIRESGLDFTFRFGAFGAETIDYVPVDLNSLLYKAETDLEKISLRLGKKAESAEWQKRAALRKEHINRYFWNEKEGMFFDYNVEKKQQSTYEYIATFFPLWVGLASPSQALAIKANLKRFERSGGLLTSTVKTGAQWDYPYGWAPFHLIAVEGLNRYGFVKDADRVSRAFLKTVTDNFYRDGTIREKYDVVSATSSTKIRVGYKSNEIGFGWTNGVYQILLKKLKVDTTRK